MNTMNALYNLAKLLIPLIIYISVLALNINKIGIFNNKAVVVVLCGISSFCMPICLAVVFFSILILILSISEFIKKHGLNNCKEYFKDNTPKEYLLIFKLINNDEISMSTNVDEFEKIKKWYENDSSIYYSLKQDTTYINLSKANIVQFSYSAITNTEVTFNPALYLLTIPVPRTLSMFNYVKALFLIPVVMLTYILYEEFVAGTSVKSILSNTSMINQIMNSGFYVVTIIFALLYVAFFMLKLLKVSSQPKSYFYEVKKQLKNKIYTYAIFNFVVIGFLAYPLLTTNFF